MKNILKYTLIAILILGVIYSTVYLIKSNRKPDTVFETETPFITNIIRKTIATGKVLPEKEIEIKPQISGIVDAIFLKEGTFIKKGTLIARVRVVPNMQSLNNAKGRVKVAKFDYDNAEKEYLRNKTLFKKKVISKQDFDTAELKYNTAKQNLKNAQNDYEIIKKGTTNEPGLTANTDIRSTVTGTILEIPVKEGYQVTQTNDFNAGTTIAVIANLKKMIFEGKVDESDVGKLKPGMPFKITLGAIEDKEFEALLNFIAPKGTEEGGTVQFKIKGDVTLSEDHFIRAGYSANASIVLEKRTDVLATREAVLQFDKKTGKPFVEIETGDQEFEKRKIKTGVSDGINVEILSGLTENDRIKIWNPTEEDKEAAQRRRRKL